jgi:hypothetical protein
MNEDMDHLIKARLMMKNTMLAYSAFAHTNELVLIRLGNKFSVKSHSYL